MTKLFLNAARLAATATTAAAGLALTATPVAAQEQQQRTAELRAIYDAYDACLAATEDGIDATALTERGWQRATMDGEATSDPMIFGNAGGQIWLVMTETGTDDTCIVLAPISEMEQLPRLLSAWDDFVLDGSTARFEHDRQPVQVAAIGTREEPKIRIIVGTRSDS